MSNKPSNTQSRRIISFVGLTLLLILIIAGAKYVGRFAGQRAAINDVQDQAQAQNAPSGLFGTQWLMTSDEVMRIVPNATQESPDKISHYTTYMGRAATVTFNFDNDRLLLILVTFNGASSNQDFQRTNNQLAQTYGPMPQPVATPQFLQYSEKRMGRFVINHCTSDPLNLGVVTEQIIFYRSK